MCVGTVLANIGDTSGSQLTPSAAVYSERNKQLEKLLHLSDLLVGGGMGEGYKFSRDNFVLLEEAEKQIEWSWHPYLAGGIMAHMLCYALFPC